MKQTDIAYLAGIIDADGTIGIKRNTYAVRVTRDSKQPTYSERVHIRQVSREALDLLALVFGGRIGIEDPSAKRGKPLFRWGCTDLKAAACLRILRPFLRIKRKQAENCLVLRATKEQSKRARMKRGRGHRGSAPRPAKYSAKMERLYMRAKELNAVGV